MKVVGSLFVVGVLVGATGCGTTLRASGQVTSEARIFAEAPRYPGQELGTGVSLVAEPRLEWDGDWQKAQLRPFYRLDPIDVRRSHFDVREAWYRATLKRSWVVSGGVGVFTWGALEAHRPSDVLNQKDFVENIDGTAQLGQPYASAAWVGESSSVELYYLPYFREQTFPGVRGRLRFPTLVDADHPEFETAYERWQPSGALRYTLAAGNVDLGLSLFTGLSREPRFVLELTSGEVVPRYDLAHQASVSIQWTLDATTLKAEAYVRAWTEDRVLFGGGGLGVDHTLFQLVGESDLTVAAEAYYDSRPVYAPVTFFDHDAFVGLRWALNDVEGTEVSAGALVDVLDGATIARVRGSRRFGEHWRASAAVHFYAGRPGTPQSAFVNDSHAAFEVAYFF